MPEVAESEQEKFPTAPGLMLLASSQNSLAQWRDFNESALDGHELFLFDLMLPDEFGETGFSGPLVAQFFVFGPRGTLAATLKEVAAAIRKVQLAELTPVDAV